MIDLDEELKKESYTREEFLIVLDYYIRSEGTWGAKIQYGWQKKINQDTPIKVKLSCREEINLYPNFVELDSYTKNPGFKFISHFPMNLRRAQEFLKIIEFVERERGFQWHTPKNPEAGDECWDGFFDFTAP